MSVIRVTNAGVYHDLSNEWLANQFHFNQLSNHSYIFDQSDYYSDIDQFVQSTHELKFATYHVPFPEASSWVNRFLAVYPHVDHSYIFCSELHQITLDQMRQLDLDRVTIFACGFVNVPFVRAKVLQWMDWIDTTGYFYRSVQPTLLNTALVPQVNKPKYFDILLGCRRTHRDHVFDYINNNGLADQVIMTYHRYWNQDLCESAEYIMERDNVEFIEPLHHTIHQVKYYGHQITMSQIVPLTIYNQTYYSLVAETNAVNEFNFYTEKIVKPMLAKRLFVVIAGQNFLKNLRSLGFRTFDGIIDESYDQTADDATRWTQALDQVQALCQRDPVEVYSQVQDIVDHNQALLLTHDWYQDFSQALATELAPFLQPLQTQN